nr:RNA-directed DNA polymerase, eukaryota [Tanacetum cinerariifolium]
MMLFKRRKFVGLLREMRILNISTLLFNRKRAHLSVKGVLVDGDWVDDPIFVKQEFCNHFATRFQDPGPSRGCLNFDFPFRLNDEQSSVLESPVTREEIRIAVWGCGEDKSPGPDGFTFEFFRMSINIHKTHLLGIGVSDVSVSEAANRIGCSVMKA